MKTIYYEVREDVVRLIYLYLLGKHFAVKKAMLPCLPIGSLYYIFSGLLINMQYVKRVGFVEKLSSYRKFLCRREIHQLSIRDKNVATYWENNKLRKHT